MMKGFEYVPMQKFRVIYIRQLFLSLFRGDKEPSSPDSIQRSTSSPSSIRSAELETTEKTQAQLVLMTILNQLKEMKEFFVRMLASKEMVELAKQLDSLGCCETVRHCPSSYSLHNV